MQLMSPADLFQLTMHPHIITPRSRIWILDEVIRHAKAKGDVWFATHAEVAQQNRRLPLPRIEIVVEISDKSCHCCKGELHQIGEDKSERLGPKRRCCLRVTRD
jgi:hypothetical protein